METKFRVIGNPTPKLDARLRVTGSAVYGQDVSLPNMLHGAILRAKYPTAAIASIDVTKAARLPGVACIITADDVDCENLGYTRDHPVLKKGEVNCIRDEIAAVAADSRATARKALELIEVEYVERPGLFDPFEAMKEEAPQVNRFVTGQKLRNLAREFHYEHGDIEEQRARSAVVVSQRYVLPRVTHCCLGTCAITADYSRSDGRLTLYSLTQVPFLYQRDMARVLKLDPSNIRVIQTVIGGGFGSKLDMYPYEPISALLSMKTGRPVQIVFSREEEFIASPTRQAMTINLTTGADEQGRFTFREVKIVKDNGAYSSWGATTSFVMMQTFSSLYHCPACRFDACAIYTNNPYAGSFRGYGNPQATFALERSIDLLADELGMKRDEIRLLNVNMPGETTGQGLRYVTCGHKDALDWVIKESARDRNAIVPDGSGRYKRGVGYASMLHVGGGAKIYRSDGCGTTVSMDNYGHLTIITGSSEIGQGSETILAMIAAEELGLPLSKIKVINTDTDVKPWDVGVHASRTTFVAGNSLLGAVRKLKLRISTKAAELMGVEPNELVYEEEELRSPLSGKSIRIEKAVREMHFEEPHELCSESYYFEPGSEFQDRQFMGNVSDAYAFAAQAVEVEVDTYTGNVRVLDIYVAQDVGKVLNPLGLAGQIEGGVVMGMGYALTEELVVVEGRVINPSFHDYRLPTASDIPKIHFHPIETEDPHGPYGAKGVGEAPLIPTAAAIANAVADAIGVGLSALPITPERVLEALEGKSKPAVERG